jgi:cell division cycle 2-like protein
MADLPAASTIRWPGSSHSRLRTRFPALSPAGLDLLGGLLTWDPEIRLTARQALQHPYFQVGPGGCCWWCG